ncbi:MAG: hypothetical protein JJE40_14945 [Vicinamibacteria bacterium]|nr:hypothetical protein [Vicinamibacteria bacterium]
MTVASARVGGLLALLVLATACESNKSANPLSPSVAGPIPGVEISAPKPLEPGANWEVSNDKQPLALLVENPGSNGQRPVTLDVEVASDEGFSTKVFTKVGVEPGPNGRTQLQLPSKLTSDRTYFWRAKGQDGANSGPWSPVVRFSIYTPAELQAPTPRSPVGGETVDDLDPSFRFKNAGRSGAVGRISYVVDIAHNDSFTSGVATYTGGEQGSASGETTVAAVSPLPANTTLYWRVRAWDGALNGPWSTTQYFKTPAAPPTAPGGGGGGGGGGTGGNPGNCASSDGEYIVDCISTKYATYRRPVGNLDQRKSNMQFLRNRIIEAGICGGLNLGWNLKRGGPEISIDFIAEARGGKTYGYDVARDYDNFRKELQLYWGEDGPGSSFKAYSPRPSCN